IAYTSSSETCRSAARRRPDRPAAPRSPDGTRGRLRPEPPVRSRQAPVLIGLVGTAPQVELGTVLGAECRVVQASAGMRVEQLAVGLRHPHLVAAPRAVVQIDRRSVAGAGLVDVHALAAYPEGAVRRHRPLL